MDDVIGLQDAELREVEGGWVRGGVFYPRLRHPKLACRQFPRWGAGFEYLEYEPGNCTRYEVLIGSLPGMRVLLAVVNMRVCMELPGKQDPFRTGYMQEKLGLGEGDCYALAWLANWYFDGMRG